MSGPLVILCYLLIGFISYCVMYKYDLLKVRTQGAAAILVMVIWPLLVFGGLSLYFFNIIGNIIGEAHDCFFKALHSILHKEDE